MRALKVFLNGVVCLLAMQSSTLAEIVMLQRSIYVEAGGAHIFDIRTQNGTSSSLVGPVNFAFKEFLLNDDYDEEYELNQNAEMGPSSFSVSADIKGVARRGNFAGVSCVANYWMVFHVTKPCTLTLTPSWVGGVPEFTVRQRIRNGNEVGYVTGFLRPTLSEDGSAFTIRLSAEPSAAYDIVFNVSDRDSPYDPADPFSFQATLVGNITDTPQAFPKIQNLVIDAPQESLSEALRGRIVEGYPQGRVTVQWAETIDQTADWSDLTSFELDQNGEGDFDIARRWASDPQPMKKFFRFAVKPY